MPDQNIQPKPSRRQRRAALFAALLVSAGYASGLTAEDSGFGANPTGPTQTGLAMPSGFQARHPLPLNETNKAAQSNPFCVAETEAVAFTQREVLPAAQQASVMQLRPLMMPQQGSAAARALAENGSDLAGNRRDLAENGSIIAETIAIPAETNPSAVYENPLVTGNTIQPVSGPVYDVFSGPAGNVGTANSTIMLMPPRNPHLAPEVVELSPETDLQAGFLADASVPLSDPIAMPSPLELGNSESVEHLEVAGTNRLPQPIQVPTAEPIVAEEDSGPVTFSLTDLGGDEEPVDVIAKSKANLYPESEAEIEPETEVEPEPAGESIASAIAPAERLVQPIVIDDPSSLTPINEVAGATRVNRFADRSAVAELVPKRDVSLHAKRYRPPVAVHPVPAAFDVSEAAPQFFVQPVMESPLLEQEVGKVDGNLEDKAENASIARSKLVPLHLNQAQVRSLTMGAEVSRVRIADTSVCQAFAAGPNQLKLIGTGSGVTELVVFAKPVAPGAKERIRAFEIHVGGTVEATGDAIGDKAEMLNQSIAEAFPDADVLVRLENGKLVAMGSCSSERAAKKIIRMVRSTCLIPVQDQLVVR